MKINKITFYHKNNSNSLFQQPGQCWYISCNAVAGDFCIDTADVHQLIYRVVIVTGFSKVTSFGENCKNVKEIIKSCEG